MAVTAGAILIAAASQTTVLAVEQDLSRYWRTAYDILVRPAGARSPVEARYGLVESNYLAGIAGGISWAQYEAIRAVPGVEVAAPVATLAHVLGYLVSPFESLPVPSDPGVYALEQVIEVDEGIGVRRSANLTYIYNGPQPAWLQGRDVMERGIRVNPLRASAWIRSLDLLLAAVDPAQEAALFGLDRAVVRGEYLTGAEAFELSTYAYGPEPKPQVDDLPVLINADPYVRFHQRNRVARVRLPAEVMTLDAILERGGVAYLATLPADPLGEQVIDSDAAYPAFVERLWRNEGELPPIVGQQVAPRTYREVRTTFDYDGLVLEADLAPGRVEFPAVFTLRAKGVYDLERLPRPADVNRVPLETYFPPVATLRYDEAGRPVEPRAFRPSSTADYSIPSPPLLLTTLPAARALVGDDLISVVRVRVGGVDALTPAAQRKIETVAGEIARRTGLDVDVMVGSSPVRVLMHVPGVGYVEEQWIQKGVSATYRERVQAGHLLLLATLLGVGGLFALDLAWAEVVARRRTIALEKALGWRSSTVFSRLLGEVANVAVVASGLGALGAALAARLLGWARPSAALLVGGPVIVVGLCAVGAAYPAWLAARLPPVIDLHRGGIRYRGGPRARQVRGVLGYAWHGLARRWSRSALGALTAALSAALLVLLLAVTVDRQGAMTGTLLGEFILVRIEGYHYAIVGIGFGLAALSLANGLLASALERRREIGVLKAVGWRTGTVARLFVAEGLLVGLIGGAAGALLGGMAFVSLYRSLPPVLSPALVVGLAAPALEGALAALYPARVAARTPPAESVRHE